MQATPDAFVVRRVFTESDEAAASIANTDLDYSLLESSRRDWVFTEARFDGLSILAGQMGAATAVSGTTHAEIFSFFVPLPPAPSWAVNGRPATDRSLGFLGPGAEHVVTMPEPSDWLLLQADAAMLEPLLVEGGHEARVCKAPVSILKPAPAALDSLKYGIRTAMGFAESHPDLLRRPSVRSALRKALVALLLPALPTAPCGCEVHRDVAITRVRAVLAEQSGHPLTVADLCLALSVSPRSLRRVFHEFFGMSPARYLRRRRLHQARRALREAVHRPTTVTEVCIAHGFFDLGRFAADYRTVFGESPSVTLKRVRQVVKDDGGDQ